MIQPQFPNSDYIKYGREIAEYDECEGFVVAGHDRRSWAALRWKLRDGDGTPGMPYRVDCRKVDVRWVTFAETCGCTKEQHDTDHLIEDKEHGDWYDCCCDYPAKLPPCGDQYSWMSISADEGDAGATPVLEWRW